MQFLGFAVLICLFQVFDFSFACKGYEAKLISIENGLTNPTLVVLPNPTVRLGKDCKLYLNGCLEILRPVKSAELSFKARKNGRLTVLDAVNVDLCELLSISNFPYQCPVKKSKACSAGKNPLNVSEYAKYLHKAVGKITVDATIVTNKWEVNTFFLKVEITKK